VESSPHSLIVRLDPDESAGAFREPHVSAFDITGKPMKAWILVQPEGIVENDQLKDWIDQETKVVKSLPKR
jgi:hypothetical protein